MQKYYNSIEDYASLNEMSDKDFKYLKSSVVNSWEYSSEEELAELLLKELKGLKKPGLQKFLKDWYSDVRRRMKCELSDVELEAWMAEYKFIK